MPPIEAIALLTPTIAAQAVFSGRRAKRGVDNIDENPIFGIMNIDIALAQLIKGARAAKGIALALDPASVSATKSIESSSKLAKGAKGVLNFTAEHINPVIWATGAAKVIFGNDDNKLEAAGRETCAIGTMRLCEEGYKYVFGMPKIKTENGISTAIEQKGALKKILEKEQIAAKHDFTKVKSFIDKTPKAVRGGAKGVCFVLASIGGYALGTKIANCLFGEKQQPCPQEATV